MRCAQCKNTWFATPERVLEEAAVAPVPRRLRPGTACGGRLCAGTASTGDVLPPATPRPADNPFAVADAPPLVPQDPTGRRGPRRNSIPACPTRARRSRRKRARQAHADRKDRPSLLRRLFSLPMLIVVMLAILLGA